MTILQPSTVFSDVAPTYCGHGAKTLWANGGFDFELTAGNTGFDLGDAPPITPWNSPWQAEFNITPYDGWTAYPIMALGNGGGDAPADSPSRTEGSRDNSLAAAGRLVQARYILDNDKQIVILEQSYNGATSTMLSCSRLLKDKFLPPAIANGDLGRRRQAGGAG